MMRGRFRAAVVGITGVILLVCASLTIVVRRAVVRRSVKEGLPITTREDFENAVEEPDEDYDVHIFNITNLAEVVETGAKPKLEEIKYALRDKEINFDLDFQDSRKLFEYKSWWTFFAKTESTRNRLEEDVIYQINPVYLGAVAEFGNSEAKMFVELSYLALQAAVFVIDGVVDVAKNGLVDAYTSVYGDENPDVDSPEYIQFATGTNLTTWEDVRAAQFGSGILSRLLGFDSVFPLITDGSVIVAPEIFGAFQVEMSVEDASAFIATFTQPNDFYSASVEEQLEYPGVTIQNLPVVLEYLYAYLPQTFFLKSFVVGYYREPGTEAADPRGETSLYLVDGIGRHNSGMFTRRSPNEMLFGYHDVIFDLIPASFSTRSLAYDGILGPLFESPRAQADSNSPLVYREYTGKKNYKKTRQYTMWRNRTTVLRRDEFPTKSGEKFSCETWEAQGYESCDIFLEPIAFADELKKQVPPFKPRKNYDVWVPEVLRVVRITFDKEAWVRGVRGRKYVVDTSALVTGNCSFETPCNPANLRYRMNGPSYHAPMHTVNGGAPSSFTRPVLGSMDRRWRDLFEGLPDYDPAKHETYVLIEPITGHFLEGKMRLQYNWDLSNTSYITWPQLFVRSDMLVFPYLWFDNNDKLKRGDARFIKRTFYAARTVSTALTVVLAAIGLVCLAAVCFYFRLEASGALAAQSAEDAQALFGDRSKAAAVEDGVEPDAVGSTAFLEMREHKSSD